MLHRADQFQAGAVSHVREAGVLVTTEVALADLAVLGAVKQCAIGFQFPNAVGGFLGVEFGHAVVVQELATAHGVAEVDLPVVVAVDVTHGSGSAAFSHNGVCLAQQ